MGADRMLEITTTYSKRAAMELQKELDLIEHDILRAEKEIALLKKRRSHIRSAFDSLVAAMDPSEQRGFIQQNDNTNQSSSKLAQSLPARMLLKKIQENAERNWRVEELQNFLRSEGSQVSEKYASNTLRKLYDQGLLQRVGRGVYRWNGSDVAIEGLDIEDYE